MNEPAGVNPLAADDLKEWETPELVVEDVKSVTRGGDEGTIKPEDDSFYS